MPRPQVNDKRLSIEHANGYDLDVSMLERFMKLPLASSSVPTSRLTIQRRMHPDIAELCRQTLYPNLKDAPSTLRHPEVADLATRSYWLDHQVPEDPQDPNSVHAKSSSNTYEVEMATGLVQHLVQTNAYGLGDIAVLTPYNGQLAKFAENMKGTCQIRLTEQDRHALFDEGLISDEDEFSKSRVTVDIKEMLRIATVDNFQGEEAKVVILLTVRSNPNKHAGFLKTTNRINVACSRAKHGFYIIGNSQTLEAVPMWAKIIDIFKSQNRLGPSLRICCSRHPQHHFDIRSPKYFASVQKCDIACGQTLECGHPCPEACHPEKLHEMIECTKTFTVKLKCGHEAQLTCREQKLGMKPRCTAVVLPSVELPCKHAVEVLCHSSREPRECRQLCNAPLPCGHSCVAKCSDCGDSNHPDCSTRCGRELPCGHTCNSVCHTGHCDPCKQPCLRSCSHGKCINSCSMICDPCVKPCARKGCTLMCCLPCNVAPEVSDDVSLVKSPMDLPHFIDTVDRMSAKMGRKLNIKAVMVDQLRQGLKESFAEFQSSIRCNVLAAKENRRLIKERLSALDGVKKELIDLRGKYLVLGLQYIVSEDAC
jgi:hypothetical protein